jgi:uncharacterized protein YdhG (YjbR/CyaY superfamily)
MKETKNKQSVGIDEYINAQSAEIQPFLQKIRETIRANVPGAIEKISWQMPTFWRNENIIHFAAFKNHIGIYPGAEAVSIFAAHLTEYETSKGAIRLPLDKPIDCNLIADIVKWRLARIKEKTNG